MGRRVPTPAQGVRMDDRRVPISVIFSDVMNTIATSGRTRAALDYEIASEVLKREIPITPEELQKRIASARMEYAMAFPPKLLTGPFYRAMVNMQALGDVCGCTLKEAFAITNRYEKLAKEYLVTDERQAFFRWLVTQHFCFGQNTPGCEVATASNTNSREVDRLLREWGVRQLFHTIPTDLDLGYTKKPDIFFYEMLKSVVEQRLDFVPFSQILVVGNSVWSDAKAVELEMNCLLIRDPGYEVPHADLVRLYGEQGASRILQITDIELDGPGCQAIKGRFRSALIPT